VWLTCPLDRDAILGRREVGAPDAGVMQRCIVVADSSGLLGRKGPQRSHVATNARQCRASMPLLSLQRSN